MEHVPSVMGTMFPERCFGTRNVFQNIWDVITGTKIINTASSHLKLSQVAKLNPSTDN
jgi:hypothetical protein